MAELNLGTSLSADDYLELVTTVNRRRNRSNARLRGLGALAGVTPTMRTSSGFDTSLRAYSKARDEEILGKIMGYAADHEFPSENDYRDWYSEQGFPEKMYEASIAEYRKRAGRRESALASQAAQATADYQKKIRPGQITKQEQEIAKEEKRLKDEHLDEGMIALVKRASEDDIADIQNSDDPASAYNEIVRRRMRELSPGWEKPHADFYKQLMEISGLKPTEVTPTGAMKALKEKMGIISPVEKIAFKEMNEEQQAQTRENYLTLTQLIKSDQKQNVLLQTLTEGPLAKRLYEEIENTIKIEDPQFFQRTFGVANAYELYAEFKAALADRKKNPEKYFIIDEDDNKQLMTPEMMEEEFVIKGVRRTGWNPDHIYSLIKPNLYETGVKYKRYRIGG